jgi:hypothetical protein
MTTVLPARALGPSMSLRVAVAAPFKRNGRSRLREQAFVVDLAIDRNWVSPDQAKQLASLAKRRGLVEEADGELVATFDLDEVTIPDGFVPDETVFQERTPFEDIVEDLVAAGFERQAAVAGINGLQDELKITADAAAVVFARREGLQVDETATRVAASLRG